MAYQRHVLQSLLPLALLLFSASAAPVPESSDNCGGSPFDTCTTIGFGVLGDSFSSGISYASANEYDKDAGSCHRIKQAYAAQLEADNDWTTAEQVLSWPACSGSLMVDIVRGRKQMDAVKSDASFLAMTIGGNNAFFGEIVEKCIYQPPFTGGTWTPDYDSDTNRVADCAKAIDKSRAELAAPASGGLSPWVSKLNDTYDDMIKHPLMAKNDKFIAYHLGYSHFFNLEPSGDWCNSKTFGVIGGGRQKLTHKLRTDINNLVEQVNESIQKAQALYPAKYKNIKYVDVSPRWNTHRFCEAGQPNQYTSNDVWFWNLSFTTDSTGTSTSDIPDYVTDPEAQSGSVGGRKGRVFHPKVGGHKAYKDAVIAAVKADKIPGVKQ